MLIIGLTGGIGSGKTTVAKLFAEKNIDVIDADEIARELVAPNLEAYTEVTKYFGSAILHPDKTINREKLRQIIFNDSTKREWLEKLLHPLIIEKIHQQIKKMTSRYGLVVIPLLIETGPYDFIDRILVVDVPEETQIQRAMIRDKNKPHTILQIMSQQMSGQARLKYADDVICNAHDLTSLQKEVQQLDVFYSELASHFQ